MRKKSHFENKEPFLENIFRDLRYRKISRFIPDNSRVLDLGCGYEGKLLKMISPRIRSGVGYDISVSTSELPENIKLIAREVDKKLDEKENAYDVVTALAVIEHVQNPKLLLSEAYRVLSSGGTLLLITPSQRAKFLLELLAFKLKLISQEEIKDHKCYYTRSSIMNILIKTGFSAKNVRRESFELGLNLLIIAKK